MYIQNPGLNLHQAPLELCNSTKPILKYRLERISNSIKLEFTIFFLELAFKHISPLFFYLYRLFNPLCCTQNIKIRAERQLKVFGESMPCLQKSEYHKKPLNSPLKEI